MTFSLGIFDLFTYAIPGFLQLGFFSYVAIRLGVVDLADVNTVPGLLLAVVAAIVSYLLGHLTYLAGSLVDRVFPLQKDGADAWQEVSYAARASGGRPVPRMNPMLLLALAELKDREVSVEVGQLRAVGLMLRSSCVPTFLGVLAGLVEVATGPHRAAAAVVAVLLAVFVVGFARQGRRLRKWANTKTYQLAYWLDVPQDDPSGS